MFLKTSLCFSTNNTDGVTPPKKGGASRNAFIIKAGQVFLYIYLQV
jgi:hypothetical protein